MKYGKKIIAIFSALTILVGVCALSAVADSDTKTLAKSDSFYVQKSGATYTLKKSNELRAQNTASFKGFAVFDLTKLPITEGTWQDYVQAAPKIMFSALQCRRTAPFECAVDGINNPNVESTGYSSANPSFGATLYDKADVTIGSFSGTGINETVTLDVTEYAKAQTNGILVFRVNGIVALNSRCGFKNLELIFDYDGNEEKPPELTAAEKLATAKEALEIETNYAADFILPVTDAEYGATIAWKSDSDAIFIADDGTASISRGAVDTVVKLTATLSLDGAEPVTKEFAVTVLKMSGNEEDEGNFSLCIPIDYDTYIRKGYETEDYSATSDMIIDGRTGSARYGVLRFRYGAAETESISALADTANQITLRLQVNKNASKADFVLFGIADEAMKQAWMNTDINYGLAQQTGILDARGTAQVPRVMSMSMENVPEGESIYLDVTDYVKTEAAEAAASGKEGVFCFLIDAENAYSSEDFFRIYSDNEKDTAEIRKPNLLVYTGHEGYARRDAMTLSIDKMYQVTENFELPLMLGQDRGTEFISRVSWKSDNEKIISLNEDGDICRAQVTRPTSVTLGETAVNLTATIENGGETESKSFTIYVLPVGVYPAQLTNYISNSSTSARTSTNPNGILYTLSNASKKNVAFVKFNTSDAAFKYSPRIVLRLQPYMMSNAFELNMTPIDSNTAARCTETMTWEDSEDLTRLTSKFSVTTEPSPLDESCMEWDVTDYIHSCGDEAAFRLDIESSGNAICMFYGNRLKYMPQLKVYNYELISDAEACINQVKKELMDLLKEMKTELSSIAGNITLPKVEKYGVEVLWATLSENGEKSPYLETDGTLIAQPGLGQDSAKVRLVATLSRPDYAGEPISVSTEGVVLSAVSDKEAVNYNKDNLKLDTSFLTNEYKLPMGFYDADITWSVEPAEAAEITNGVITAIRGETDKAAEVIAVITKGTEASVQKRFPVTVLRKKDGNLLCGRKAEGNNAETEKINDDNGATAFAASSDFTLKYNLPSAKSANTAVIAAKNTENIEKISVYECSDSEKGKLLGVFEEFSDISELYFTETKIRSICFEFSLRGEVGICEIGLFNHNKEEVKTAEAIISNEKFAELAGIPTKAIGEDFTLKTEVDGAQISYMSSDSDIINLFEQNGTIKAEITKTSRSQNVNITVKVTYNGKTAERSFLVSVSAEDKSAGGGNGGGGGGRGSSSGMTAAPPVGNKQEDNLNPDKFILKFNDIANVEWAHNAIYSLCERGIISGRSTEEFAPNDEITREEYVKLLVLMLGIMPEGTCEFNDALRGAWYCPYIAVAVSNGLAEGMGDGSFGVGKPVLRQDAAVFLARALDFAKIKSQTKEPSFADSADISSYARNEVGTMQLLGIFNGDENGRMNPKNTLTRAEAAKIIYLLMEKIS